MTATNSICDDVASKIMVVGNATTGLSIKGSEALKVYGQGNHLIIEFNSTNSDKANLAMFNMLGQKVESINDLSTINGRSEVILTNIKPGYYIVQVLTGSKVYNKKIHLSFN
jgi:hypothetical protein